jgi:hypothetical protein
VSIWHSLRSADEARMIVGRDVPKTEDRIAEKYSNEAPSDLKNKCKAKKKGKVKHSLGTIPVSKSSSFLKAATERSIESLLTQLGQSSAMVTMTDWHGSDQ